MLRKLRFKLKNGVLIKKSVYNYGTFLSIFFVLNFISPILEHFLEDNLIIMHISILFHHVVIFFRKNLTTKDFFITIREFYIKLEYARSFEDLDS